MFDDLLTSRRGKFTLLEWAERDGWLPDITALLPLEIAILIFPYTQLDEDEEDVYDTERNDFFALCDALIHACATGELPHETVNLYDYNPRFRFYGHVETKAYKEYFELREPRYGRYETALTWLSARQGSLCDYRRIEIELIQREDLRQWLIDKGKWPSTKYLMLAKWFSGSEQETTGEAIPRSQNRPGNGPHHEFPTTPAANKGKTQLKREEALSAWLIEQEAADGSFDRWHIEFTHDHVWSELSKYSGHFRAMGDRTLVEFFMAARHLCGFKRGRK